MTTKPRTGIPGVKGLGSVVNRSAWGEAAATKRYGGTTRTFPPPPDRSAPQELGDQNNLRGPLNDVANDWRRGNGMKPNFDYSPGGKK
jgi:hypothetical protein